MESFKDVFVLMGPVEPGMDLGFRLCATLADLDSVFAPIKNQSLEGSAGSDQSAGPGLVVFAAVMELMGYFTLFLLKISPVRARRAASVTEDVSQSGGC